MKPSEKEHLDRLGVKPSRQTNRRMRSRKRGRDETGRKQQEKK